MMRKVKTATEQLEQELERQPTAHEIATHLDVTVEAVQRTRAIDQKVSSSIRRSIMKAGTLLNSIQRRCSIAHGVARTRRSAERNRWGIERFARETG